MSKEFDGFEWDPKKRAATLSLRGLDFEIATRVFDDPFYFEFEDDREAYGEVRNVTVGMVEDLGLVIVVVWTPRDKRRRIVSVRPAQEREKSEYRRWRSSF